MKRGCVFYHSVNREQLVSPLQAPLAVRHPPGDDPGDVDGGVLLLAPHDVEAQALLRLGQLHHPRVGVALAGGECRDCGLRGRREIRKHPLMTSTVTARVVTNTGDNALCQWVTE